MAYPTTGTVRPFTFKGCKLSGAEFSCKVDELLTMSLDVDGQQASEVETLVAASLATQGRPFHWHRCRSSSARSALRLRCPGSRLLSQIRPRAWPQSACGRGWVEG